VGGESYEIGESTPLVEMRRHLYVHGRLWLEVTEDGGSRGRYATWTHDVKRRSDLLNMLGEVESNLMESSGG